MRVLLFIPSVFVDLAWSTQRPSSPLAVHLIVIPTSREIWGSQTVGHRNWWTGGGGGKHGIGVGGLFLNPPVTMLKGSKFHNEELVTTVPLCNVLVDHCGILHPW